MIFEKTKHAVSFFDLILLVYGYAKVGKTLLASHLVRDGRPPLFLMSEDGHLALDVHAVRIKSWDDFLKAVKKIVSHSKEIKAEHSVVILDLASEIEELCAQHVARAHGVCYLGDVPHGRAWYIAKDSFQSAVRELLTVLPVTFLTHAKEREVEVQGKVITAIAPSISRSAFEFITGKADVIAYLAPTKDGKATLTMRPQPGLIAGSRFPALAQKDFVFDVNNPAAVVRELEQVFSKGGVPHDA